MPIAVRHRLPTMLLLGLSVAGLAAVPTETLGQQANWTVAHPGSTLTGQRFSGDAAARVYLVPSQEHDAVLTVIVTSPDGPVGLSVLSTQFGFGSVTGAAAYGRVTVTHCQFAGDATRITVTPTDNEATTFSIAVDAGVIVQQPVTSAPVGDSEIPLRLSECHRDLGGYFRLDTVTVTPQATGWMTLRPDERSTVQFDVVGGGLPLDLGTGGSADGVALPVIRGVARQVAVRVPDRGDDRAQALLARIDPAVPVEDTTAFQADLSSRFLSGQAFASFLLDSLTQLTPDLRWSVLGATGTAFVTNTAGNVLGEYDVSGTRSTALDFVSGAPLLLALKLQRSPGNDAVVFQLRGSLDSIRLAPATIAIPPDRQQFRFTMHPDSQIDIDLSVGLGDGRVTIVGDGSARFELAYQGETIAPEVRETLPDGQVSRGFDIPEKGQYTLSLNNTIGVRSQFELAVRWRDLVTRIPDSVTVTTDESRYRVEVDADGELVIPVAVAGSDGALLVFVDARADVALLGPDDQPLADQQNVMADGRASHSFVVRRAAGLTLSIRNGGRGRLREVLVMRWVDSVR